MLRFEMDVLAADLMTRTIEGVIVPYGEAARVPGHPAPLRFSSGSVRLARARTPLLLDHDRGRPVGVLAELRDTPAGAFATFRIDQTPAGDEALTQAASGSRGAFSIGAELDPGSTAAGADGVVDVRGSAVHEVSLLALGAFPGAGVTRVAAESDEPEAEPVAAPVEPDEDEDEDEDDDPDSDPAGAAGNPDQEALPMDATLEAAPTMILAERSPSPRELTAGEYAHLSIRAQQGDRAARQMIEAALTETISTDLAGVLPPQYESSVIGPAPVDRVLYDVFRGRPLPGVGLQVQKPTWTTPPVGAWAATVDADATTSKAVIGLNAATIERWDWASALSYTAVQRSSPDAINTIYAAAVQNFYLAVEIKIANLAIATAGAPNAAIKLGDGIAAFYARSGRAPEVIVVSPDEWGFLADAGGLVPPIAMSGASVDAGAGGLRSTFAGLPIVASGALPSTTKLLATRRALDVRVTDPVQLTANAIGALNVELGVVGEGLFDADVPLELMLLTAGAPVFADASSSKGSR
jgi:HK97 family phage prohead protease